MIFSLKNIKRVALLVVAGLILTACGNKEDDIIDGPLTADTQSKPMVTLHIQPVTTRQNSGKVVEKVKSLRIIMLNQIDDKEYVEFNKYIDFSGITADPDVSSSGDEAAAFNYIFSRVSVPGKKKFYLIANEESVESLSFADEETTPDWVQGSISLTQLLDHYKEEYIPGYENMHQFENNHSEVTTALGKQFEEVMNSVYFMPEYTVNSKNEVFLPYSAYYGDYELKETTEADGSVAYRTINAEMYLVPIATKFDFKIINYRKNPVQIDNIEVQSINKSSFLNAQLASSELYRDNGKWWIDWLAECSRLSQNSPDLPTFNDLWGWVSGFDIPLDDKSDFTVKILNEDNEYWEVKELVDISDPDILNLGPYYFPESKNLVEKQILNTETNQFETKLVETYYVNFTMHDLKIDRPFDSGLMEIVNLKSMFRATHITIYVNLRQSEVEIYAEMAPWNLIEFKGYVQEEDD